MNLSLKKRTSTQVALSEANGDNTGGYNFVGWVIHQNRLIKFFAPIILFLLGFVLRSEPVMDMSYDETFQFWASVVLNVVGPIWEWFTVREYRELKRNIAR